MPEPELETHFELTGEVNAGNFNQWLRLGEAWVSDHGEASLTIDLSALTRSNSLAVALLLGWLRCADRLGKTVEFAQVPVGLRDIIEFSGLSDLLLVADAEST